MTEQAEPAPRRSWNALRRIAAIHPGWWIAAFFVTLVAFNIVFFSIAAYQGADLLPTPYETAADAAPTKASPLAPAGDRVGR